MQGKDGADLLLYGGGQAFDDAAGLMEASYRNLPEARVALQALHSLMTAGQSQHTLLSEVHIPRHVFYAAEALVVLLSVNVERHAFTGASGGCFAAACLV